MSEEYKQMQFLEDPEFQKVELKNKLSYDVIQTFALGFPSLFIAVMSSNDLYTVLNTTNSEFLTSRVAIDVLTLLSAYFFGRISANHCISALATYKELRK